MLVDAKGWVMDGMHMEKQIKTCGTGGPMIVPKFSPWYEELCRGLDSFFNYDDGEWQL